MNLGQLRATLRELLGDQVQPYLWPDATLDRFLNNAVREACLRARLLKDDAISQPRLCVVPFAAGEQLVRYADAILVVRSATLAHHPHRKLWALTAESMDRQYHHWERWCGNLPECMVMDLSAKTLRLVPTPVEDGVLHLRVWRVPLVAEQLCRNDDTPAIWLPDPEELKHWAAHEAYLIKDTETFDADAAATHLQLFEQRFGARPSLHEMARWADSPPRVRHAHLF